MPRNRHGQPANMAEAFGNLKADYTAAKASRFRRRRTGVNPMGSGADYHYRNESDYLRIIEQARDMDRNDAIVGQTVNRAVTNTVQDGFKLDPQTPDKSLNKDLYAQFDEWACDPEQCDIAGEMSFAEMQGIVPRHTVVDGDHVGLGLRSGHLQLVEGHRVRKPSFTKQNVVNGVLLDKFRKRIEYWVTVDDVSPLDAVKTNAEVVRYPVRDESGVRQIFHVYDPKRVSQTRGVSAFAPIFDTSGQFEDINFAKMVQQQVVSCFAIFREKALDFTGAPPAQQGSRETVVEDDGTTKQLEGISPGMIIDGRPGEQLKGFSPSVPNAEFFQHVKLMLTIIGINLGLPLVLVLMDASETNFSGWRGAVEQARMGFRHNQRWLMRRFLQPVYVWKLHQFIGKDPAMRAASEKFGKEFFAHRWNPPSWPYIEPLKDASSDLLLRRNLGSSPRRIHASRGCHWEEIVDESIDDNAYAIVKAKTRAKEINAQFPDDQPVHWHEVMSLPTPDRVSVALSENNGDEANANAKPSAA